MKKPKQPYQITVRWSEPDRSYEAAGLWLETAKAEGKPIPASGWPPWLRS